MIITDVLVMVTVVGCGIIFNDSTAIPLLAISTSGCV